MIPGYRLAPSPHFHTVAEMAAFPIASEAAFRLAAMELRPNLGGTTSGLWRCAEQEIVGATTGLSLDEALSLRDAVWFGPQDANQGKTEPLHTYLRRLADWFLTGDGAESRPDIRRGPFGGKSRDTPMLSRQAWRWISLALPTDLLASAVVLEGTSYRVNTVSRTLLARMKSGDGFAEPHLHLGAGMDFPLLWASAMRAVASPEFQATTLASPGGCFDDGKSLPLALLSAALGRLVATWFLVSRIAGEAMCRFWDRRSPHLIDVLGPADFSLLLTALDDLSSGKIPCEDTRGPSDTNDSEPSTWDESRRFGLLQSCYRRFQAVVKRYPRTDREWRPDEPGDWCEKAMRKDPVRGAIGKLPPGDTGEAWLIRSSLLYLDDLYGKGGKRRLDPVFERLFWQSTRVRCLFHRHVIQRPMTPGLHWFLRFYDRPRAIRRVLDDSTRFEAATRSSGWRLGLASMEARTTPEVSVSKNLKLLQDLQKVIGHLDPSGGDLEAGVVVHFVRSRGERALHGGRQQGFWSGTEGDPSPHLTRGGDRFEGVTVNPAGYRYSRFYLAKKREAQSLARLMLSFPHCLAWLRGLDLCTDEAGIPSWVMAPILRYTHEASQMASRMTNGELLNPLPPLRRSFHAGEDFVHLLTGLRRFHEPKLFLGLEEGDRIGHGVSLGMDANRWAERTARVAVLREDRLFDLAWAWHWYHRSDKVLPQAQLPRIETEIVELAGKLFDPERVESQASVKRDQLTPARIWKMIQNLHDERVLRQLGFPTGPDPDDSVLGKHSLEFRWLTDSRLFTRGHEMVWVDTHAEAELLAALQRVLIQEIAESAITIEINPSSNLLIAQLSDLDDHPLWGLLSTEGDRDRASIEITVGSDDPLTFSTDLLNEYQLLHDSIVLRGQSVVEANELLDRLKTAGMASRFTVSRRKRSSRPTSETDRTSDRSRQESQSWDFVEHPGRTVNLLPYPMP